MNAEIISIGDELLTGNTVDTNSLYISSKLSEIGIFVLFKTIVGDKKEDIKNVLNTALNRVDIIFLTGGLGPTHDDKTREAISEFTQKRLILDEKILDKIQKFFKHRNILMPENNKLQAYIPEGAKVFKNIAGTAPGFLVEYKQKLIIALPGVPFEVKNMFETEIIPYLKEIYENKYIFKTKILKCVGLPESVIEEKIKTILQTDENLKIGFLPYHTEIHIKIEAYGEKESVYRKIDNIKNFIYEKIGENIYGEDKETLEEKVAKKLIKNNFSISTAESCTSGLLAYRLTNISGSSKYFKGGLNAYSNDVKVNVLKVNKNIIEKYGAVSYECAYEMTKNCKEIFDTDIAISITGIAGPTGGSKEKPVGLVYIGINFKNKIDVYKYIFTGNRDIIRAKSAHTALFLLYKNL